MNKMIAITIRPGATTAAAKADLPLRVQEPAAGGDEHSMKCRASPRTAAATRAAGHRTPCDAELERQQVPRARPQESGLASYSITRCSGSDTLTS